jgi:hypothetical protein
MRTSLRKHLMAMERAVFIGGCSRSLPAISIALSNRVQMTGKN